MSVAQIMVFTDCNRMSPDEAARNAAAQANQFLRENYVRLVSQSISVVCNSEYDDYSATISVAYKSSG